MVNGQDGEGLKVRNRAEPHSAILEMLFGNVWTPSCRAPEASKDVK